MMLDELVSRHYSGLSENDKYIWQYISANREESSNLSINVLAERCAVSRTTLMRFAQKIGLKGFSELKTHLRWETAQQTHLESNIVEKICENNINTIKRYEKMNCDEICEALYQAHNIFIFGTGSLQREVAIELKRMFLSINIIALDLPGEGELRKSVNLLNSGDVIFIISKSGESDFLNSQLNLFESKGVKVISLTKSQHNTLAQKSDYNLFASIEKFELSNISSFETMIQMFLVIEILFAKFISYDITKLSRNK